MTENNIEKVLEQLFKTQKLAVVATNMEGLPYSTLVAFVASDDLKNLFFATLKDTRKYNNIIKNPKITMIIDDRKNNPSDFYETIAVTAEGRAKVIENKQSSSLNLYLNKHPYLSDFVTSENCAFIKIEVEKYHFVSRFQNVKILVPQE